MKTQCKKFIIKYAFNCSFWENERMAVLALNKEQAKEKVLNEISMAYGSHFVKDVIFKD